MIKLLVVDDHAIVREGVRRILLEDPLVAAVDDVDAGVKAIEMVRGGDYDVVLLDISLPGPDGLEVLKQILLERPEVKVVIFSMFPESQFALRMLRAGAVGYLTKDRAPAELVAAVRKVAAGGRYVTASLAERLADELARGKERLPHEKLSDRESQVLRMIAIGLTVSQIAQELALSVKTISTYRRRLLDKMGLKTNAELTSYALRNGLVE